MDIMTGADNREWRRWLVGEMIGRQNAGRIEQAAIEGKDLYCFQKLLYQMLTNVEGWNSVISLSLAREVAEIVSLRVLWRKVLYSPSLPDFYGFLEDLTLEHQLRPKRA